jgi:hypothetical protein
MGGVARPNEPDLKNFPDSTAADVDRRISAQKLAALELAALELAALELAALNLLL